MEYTEAVENGGSPSEFAGVNRKQLLALKRIASAAMHGALMPSVAEKVAQDRTDETGFLVPAAAIRRNIADIANKIDFALDE